MTSLVRPKIVIVDDDPLIMKVVARMLARLQVEVVTSRQSIGIMSLIATHRPTLVLLDVNMPGLGGPALVKLIREDPEIRGTTILLYSSLEQEVLAAKAEECGADGYIPKTLGGLSRHLEKWLNQKAPPV